MVYSFNSPKIRSKAVWGRRLVATFALIALFVAASPANAQKKPKADKPAKVHHSKLDKALNVVADGNGESDVIIEFNDNNDGASLIRSNGGRSGKRLGILKARAGRMPNAFLKRLANDPRVKRIHKDRDAEAMVARTAAAIGALTARAYYGYTGAGIGVAVIDSGVTAWHDDLSLVNGQGQRVTAFVDFVNGQTQKYDDWGHGTHVAGVIAGNGRDTYGIRSSVAPGANIIALKALDAEGKGHISDIIAALDWAVTNKAQYNIRVINMSLGAGVFESYDTDPLTVAAKRAVEAGIVVVAAAGNMGQSLNGQAQYGAIPAPGNAPWVLTVGASSTMGTITRVDDTMASYSSRGPTMIDYAAKPDLVAPGSGTVSLSDPLSAMYTTKAAYLSPGLRHTSYLPYLTLSGTSMSTPVVAGTVALMLQANPSLTPNMVKAVLQFTSQVRPQYDYLTQGAGFLNALGAVKLSRFFAHAQPGDGYPSMNGWSKHIFWGNRRVSGGVLTPGGTAWGNNIVWGDALTPLGQNIVWGENCTEASCENIVWGNNIVWGEECEGEDCNIVWGNTDGDNVVWGNDDDENIVWGNDGDENIVWGSDCAGDDCENIVWGNTDDENIVWGNNDDENIVWGNDCEGDDCNIVWGNNDDENIVWGNDVGDVDVFGDDTVEIESFDPSVWEDLFAVPPVTTPPGGGL